MHNDINFDNYVKDLLHNHKKPVPSGLWDKIVAEKDTKKPVATWWTDKRWYMLAAACLILVCSTYLLLHNKKENYLASQNKKQLKTDKQIAESNNTLPVTTKIEQNIDNNTTLNQQNNTPNTTTDLETTQKQTNNITKGTSKLGKQFLKRSDFKMLNTSTDSKNTGSNQPLSSNDGSIVTSQMPTLANEYTSRITKENTVSLTNLSRFESKNPTSLQLSNNKQIFGLDCPNSNPATWYLEAYGSPDYTMKNIYAFGVNDDYLKRIDSTTKMNGGFTVGLRVSKTISDNILLKSGLQFAQRNEQFISKSDSIITTTSVVTVRTVIRGGGFSDTTVRDTSLLQQIGYRKRITNNQYKSIEIPLLLSYERGNDKWRIAVNGGVIANLSSWYNGETLDTSYQLIPLSAKKSNGFYKSNLNLSLYAGVSIIRRVSTNIEAFAEPYFRYGLSNTNSSTIGYSQRFNAAGISFGIRYKLNGKGSKATN
jgi:hypothetical protein